MEELRSAMGNRRPTAKILTQRFNAEVERLKKAGDKRVLFLKTEGNVKEYLEEVKKRAKMSATLASKAAELKKLRKALRNNLGSSPIPTVRRVAEAAPVTPAGASTTRRQGRHRGKRTRADVAVDRPTEAQGDDQTMADSTGQPDSPQQPRRRRVSTAVASGHLHYCSVCHEPKYTNDGRHRKSGWCGVLHEWGLRAKCKTTKLTRRVCGCVECKDLAEKHRRMDEMMQTRVEQVTVQ